MCVVNFKEQIELININTGFKKCNFIASIDPQTTEDLNFFHLLLCNPHFNIFRQNIQT